MSMYKKEWCVGSLRAWSGLEKRAWCLGSFIVGPVRKHYNNKVEVRA